MLRHGVKPDAARCTVHAHATRAALATRSKAVSHASDMISIFGKVGGHNDALILCTWKLAQDFDEEACALNSPTQALRLRARLDWTELMPE